MMIPANDGLGTLPQWARIVALVGVPSAIALYLVWAVVSLYTSRQDLMLDLIRSQDQVSAIHVMTASEHYTETNRRQEELQRYLRMICVNTAPSSTDRQNCLSGR